MIELLSESDSLAGLTPKMDMWMANGAELTWVIDPCARTVRIDRRGAEREVLDQPEVVVAETVVPGFRLNTPQLWDDCNR